MNARLEELIKSIEGMEYFVTSKDFAAFGKQISSHRAYIKTISILLIESIADLKDVEVSEVQNRFDELLEHHLADELAELFSKRGHNPSPDAGGAINPLP